MLDRASKSNEKRFLDPVCPGHVEGRSRRGTRVEMVSMMQDPLTNVQFRLQPSGALLSSVASNTGSADDFGFNVFMVQQWLFDGHTPHRTTSVASSRVAPAVISLTSTWIKKKMFIANKHTCATDLSGTRSDQTALNAMVVMKPQ